MTSSEFIVADTFRTNLRGPVRWIVSHLRRSWWLVLLIFIGAFGNASLASAIPIYTGQAFNAVSGASVNLRALYWTSGIMVGTQLIRALLQLARNGGSEIVAQRLERDVRQELYGALLGKSMRFHDGQATGDTMARATNDVREMALMIAPGLNMVIGSGNFLLVPILVAPSIHPQLVWTPAVFAVAFVLALAHYLYELNPVTSAVRAGFGHLNTGLAAAIEGIETVKGAAREREEIEQFNENARSLRNAFVDQGRVEARFLPLLLLGIANAAGLWHGLALFQRGEVNTGDVVSYMGLLSLFSFPVAVSLFSYAQVSTGLSSARRILELIRADTELDRNESGYTGEMMGDVQFTGVTFRYERLPAVDGEDAQDVAGGGTIDLPALEDVSFRIQAGQTVALVGQTGSGKTSVAKLINRIYDVGEGSVAVDGVDVRAWNLADLRRQISIIEQDIFLFSRTIRNNIAFGKPDASDEEVMEAARAAQAHEFITGFPDGYETVVGERGVMLSGGQRQRIALARAFLTDPAILILDDSTSAIDSATEDKIQRAIENASSGRTTILITHRLSQIRWADQIIVLRKGRVVASGSHDELLAQSEAYRNIFARI